MDVQERTFENGELTVCGCDIFDSFKSEKNHVKGQTQIG
jgi:hypothetical protein